MACGLTSNCNLGSERRKKKPTHRRQKRRGVQEGENKSKKMVYTVTDGQSYCQAEIFQKIQENFSRHFMLDRRMLFISIACVVYVCVYLYILLLWVQPTNYVFICLYKIKCIMVQLEQFIELAICIAYTQHMCNVYIQYIVFMCYINAYIQM